MSNFSVYSVSAINSLSGTYPDPFFKVKQYREGYEQGFALNKINALTDVMDTSINNYTSHYLTSKKYLEDIFEVEDLEFPVKTITTSLIFDSFTNEQQPKYLYIYKNTLSGAQLSAAACKALLSSFVGFNNNTNFEIEFINNILCRVKHNDGKDDYYMTYVQPSSSQPVAFHRGWGDLNTVTTERADTFRYILDSDGYLQLFKKTDKGAEVLTALTTGLSTVSNLFFVPILSSTSYKTNSNVIKINYSINSITPKLKSSWVSYVPFKQNNLTINEDKSIFDRKDQYLLHTNVNESRNEIELNYLTLNNIRSEKSSLHRGTNMLDSSPFVPGVEFRDYNALVTGNNQEKGNDNISLTYTWYDKDIKIPAGTDTVFRAPSSIYPFDRLNVNDSKFSVNGSFAGYSPKIADKIYHLRRDTTSFNNGKYLCTWLSGSTTTPGVWVDRYYYPDIASKVDLYSGVPVFSPSLNNPVDSIGLVDPQALGAQAFFDKKSDLCIEPNGLYRYSRISSEEITEYLATTNPLVSTFTNYYNTGNVSIPYISDEILYDGRRYNKFPISKTINDKNSFTVSFDMYVDPEKEYGFQIMGNLTNRGFGVVSDTYITPFVITYANTTLKVYNTNLELLHITEFDTNILDVVRGEGLSDYFVICTGGAVYRVNSLGIKVKSKTISDIVGYTNVFFSGDSLFFLKKATSESTTTYNYVEVRVSDLTAIVTNKAVKQLKSLTSSYTTFREINSIILYRGEVYGFPGSDIKYLNEDEIIYTINNDTIIRHNLKLDELVVLLESRGGQNDNDLFLGVVDITADENYIYVIHKRSLLSVFTYSLDKVFSFDLNEISPNCIVGSVDVIKQYVSVDQPAQNNTDVVVTFTDSSNNRFLYVLSSSLAVNTGLIKAFDSPEGRSRSYNLTNGNWYNRYYKYDPQKNKYVIDKRNIKFVTTLVNYLNTDDVLTDVINLDYKELDKGYHTFTYRFDPIQGNITLFIDGVLFRNNSIPAGKYGIQDIFNDDFYIGTAGFYNNVDFATYLNQPGYYYARDVKVKNLFIYDRPIKDEEVLALDVYKTDINDLTISIPAGQRNNIEEIERYFKLSQKYNVSNDINIYIKNTGITDVNLQNNIKNLILNDARAILPLGVNINNIEFIDFL